MPFPKYLSKRKLLSPGTSGLEQKSFKFIMSLLPHIKSVMSFILSPSLYSCFTYHIKQNLGKDTFNLNNTIPFSPEVLNFRIYERPFQNTDSTKLNL